MKKKLVEITLSVICVSVVCVICIRTFTTSSLLGNNMLLIENIEALSDNEPHTECDAPADPKSCWADDNAFDYRGMSWTQTKKVKSYGSCMCLGASCSCPKGSSPR
ncbi:NVEALA domain-containing protein [Prevotella sp. P3-122]|uniref:NVEALA domain-containing protein n=1 Tax=Prevotella sp. P3-122 TaxID=2024223 RepID=UPI0011402A90|nr:hypothetical protein [Prevotella sp. P3-122]